MKLRNALFIGLVSILILLNFSPWVGGIRSIKLLDDVSLGLLIWLGSPLLLFAAVTLMIINLQKGDAND
ncbi:MAG: hypothetical protein ABJ242_05900 [Marinomonas sp.]